MDKRIFRISLTAALAGFLFGFAVTPFPDGNQVVRTGPYQFTIISMEDIRIDIVKLTLLKVDES